MLIIKINCVLYGGLVTKSDQLEHLYYCLLSNYTSNKPTTIGLIRYKQSTHTKYVTSLSKRLMGSSWTPGIRKSLTHLPPSFPWLTPETLDSRSVFHFVSNTRNKQKNSSTRYIRLKHVTNCWAVAHETGWRDAPFALRNFSRSNKYLGNFSLNWQFWLFGPNLPQKGISSQKQKKQTLWLSSGYSN